MYGHASCVHAVSALYTDVNAFAIFLHCCVQVGCTNLKRLLLYMGNHLPMGTIEWPWVEDSIYLEPALQHASFLNKTLTAKEKLQRMKDYYKFVIVRNPLERLISGYRNKVEKPVRWVYM